MTYKNNASSRHQFLKQGTARTDDLDTYFLSSVEEKLHNIFNFIKLIPKTVTERSKTIQSKFECKITKLI